MDWTSAQTHFTDDLMTLFLVIPHTPLRAVQNNKFLFSFEFCLVSVLLRIKNVWTLWIVLQSLLWTLWTLLRAVLWTVLWTLLWTQCLRTVLRNRTLLRVLRWLLLSTRQGLSLPSQVR
ncbi:uncharacterized protein LOC111064721 isoform X2 [Drosophila obscura]|uniref:uncharacterized protein LOC111064721 isoform X2 n=1 Tax=Drosophila obscura TaxID=7282 RepID=UPI001BB203DF|nr:uncharacterized protein LOC111064721 isoform X2 [Drosophila obscura]